MADVVISFVVQNIIPALHEKLTEVGDVETDVERIREELDRMTAFLKDADSSMDNVDKETTNWVDEVRDVAYDTEDVLDKFVLGLTKTSQGSGCSNAVLHKSLNCIINLRFNSRIVSEIKSIDTRVSRIAEGRQRYQNPAGGSISIRNTSFDLADDTRGDALLEEEVNLVGIEKPKSDLKRLVMESGSGLRVIAVEGMAGVGKSALVRAVYDDAEVKNHFKSHAWITVPWLINMEDILKDLIRQLFHEAKEASPEGNTVKNIQLKEEIKKFLGGKRYVIVFDDVRDTQEWNAVRCAFPDDSSSSRLIVTTRNSVVARNSCAPSSEENVYTLKPLAEDQSSKLFCQKTFRGGECPDHLKKITESILKKCAGLPLAIKSVGGILASMGNTLADWETLDRGLEAEVEKIDRSLNMILLISFNDLPYHLKYCLLYMAIYPEYYLIKGNSLIRLWIMEGFVEQKEGRTLEEVAQGYLKELANKNLIQVVKSAGNGNIKACRINYFLRENLLRKSKRQSFLMTVDKNSGVQWNNKARCLSIHGSWPNFKPQMSGEKLRSLLAFGVTDSKSITSIPLESFPKVITKLLLLRYLSLRRTNIKSLPKSIKKLQALETLDLKYSPVAELPVEILQLRKLRHLVMGQRGGYAKDSHVPIDNLPGVKLPNKIGGLTSLYQLYFIDATRDIIEELGKMKELRRLFIFKLRREYGKRVCSSIGKLENLQSLALFSTEGNEILDLDDMSSPPASLQQLYLSGRLEKFPNWIKSLNSLVKVYFGWSRLGDDPLQYLQDLPSLVRLELLDGYVGEELRFTAGKFQSLQKLYLNKLQPLKRVIIEKGAMPNLRRIKIQRCKYLESVPSGIESLTKMKVLKVFYMSSQFIQKVCSDDKIAHIHKQFWENDDKETDD